MSTIKKDNRYYFEQAAIEARRATCLRARCGSIIVDVAGNIIGRGHNSPAREDESQRTCLVEWDTVKKPKYDTTCCVHAEWNAILNVCKTSPDLINGSTLYFMRIDGEGNFTDAGEPYCTVCSRLALQSGIAYFALWNHGPDIRTTADYNTQSYQFYRTSK